ncbi:AcrR family transcriptional regulator [Clostridium moniliforme]|uniref:AcrR family transcriptional regulator n=1 Tax=Clostridium moniliforme TaxID=39489 RepID=A0ABS4EYC4_9CLOT|nr:TetR/AcrR family transcriptional regulator [Clostridium moniliforme]MBP1889005.1 AcrR family transcriptional regulator [Clostridium moniliforme]
MPKILESPREKILKEAKIELEKNGYKKLSMRELAKTCNIGLGTLYNYFKNKNEILKCIIREDWDYVIDELKEVNLLNIGFDEKIKFIYDKLNCYMLKYIDIFIEFSNEERDIIFKHENIFRPLYLITDDMILFYKRNKTINSSLDERTLSKFLITNILTIIKTKIFSVDDLICILTNK